MYDVAVIGAGIMGAATARALTDAGRKVVLLEQFELGHTRGSSHGRARIFRFSYPDPMYVAMAQDALVLWARLEEQAGDNLLTTTGGLDTGKGLHDHIDALRGCGADYEVMDGADVAKRFSSVTIPADQEVLYQPDAGVIAADRAHAAFLAVARSNGADVQPRTRVTAIEPRADGVVVRTEQREIETRAAVVTAGAWAKPLLSQIGIELDVRPTRETVAFFRMDGPFPPTLVEWGEPSAYGLGSEDQGIKVGEHQAGPTADPDEEAGPDPQSIARLSEWVSRRYPHAERTPHFAETCLYTNTPDEHFVIERHDRVVVGSPCTGHGFKFAPLIGQRLAGLAAEVL